MLEEPKIIIRGIPPEEHELARHTNSQISMIQFRINEFADTLALFDFCTEGARAEANIGRFTRWRFVAARGAAITLYNFHHTLIGLRENYGKAPTVRRYADVEHMRSANRLWETYFSGAGKMRHAVAHAGEQIKNPDVMKANSIKNGDVPNVVVSGGSELFVGESLFGRTLTMPAFGEYASVEVSQETINKLIEIRDAVHKAFWPVFAATENAFLSKTVLQS